MDLIIIQARGGRLQSLADKFFLYIFGKKLYKLEDQG